MCIFACWGSQELWVNSDLRCCSLGSHNHHNTSREEVVARERDRDRERERGSGRGSSRISHSELRRDFSFDMVDDSTDQISMEVPSLNFETTAAFSRNQVSMRA